MPISGEKGKKSSIFYYEPPGLCWKSKASLILSDQNLFISCTSILIFFFNLNESLSSPASLI